MVTMRQDGGRPLLQVDRVGQVLRLTLDNPPANVLSLALLQQLVAEIESAQADESLRVIVIAASGKLFSAGHDLKELTLHRADGDGGRVFFEGTFEACSRLMQAIVLCPKPVIAQVDGVATAAGCQLVASCDLAIASDRSTFGVNGINVGLFCTSPAVAITRNISRKRAMEMLLTGAMIDAATAAEFGLLNRVVPPEELIETVDELARVIAEKSSIAIALGKQAVHRHAEMDLASAYDDATRVMVENLLHPDAKAGIESFITRARPATS